MGSPQSCVGDWGAEMSLDEISTEPWDESLASDLPLTELGLARRLVQSFDGRVRYAPQIRSWYFYDGQRWAEDITGEIVRRAKQVIDGLYAEARFSPDKREELTRAWLKFQSASRIRSVVELATTEPDVPVLMDEFDADHYALNVANGAVDLRTGTLRPHDPAELHSKVVPIPYDPDAVAPIWERFLREVFNGDETLVGFVQRYAGYSLTGDVREQLLLFGHGGGANGKSTMFGMLRQLAGDYGVQLDPELLTVGAHENHPTGLTDLRGARMVTTTETEAGKRLAEALVKSLTGGDPIRARRMRQDYFEFMPSHHIWLASNHLPPIRGTDWGIWRRIALVPFDVSFEGEQRDEELPVALAAEARGILAWAVRGCLEWQQGGLRIPERVQAATAQYRADNDHVGRFIADCCVVNDSAYVACKALRDAYEVWCAENSENVWSSTALGKALRGRNFDSTQMGTSRTRTWLGIGLANAEGEQV